ncbi:DUF1836 domain-containing protein [Paenibacillus sp. sptzw28]|uniref:DUF1836 domain-containing protein n=1 Tax=Paenibacillus sp. sptzw28 TaxID=715179 RepID=UPI001C6F20B4|nr:DUF1836 domain-containing protein [Paenibacillus sp. sptzw28]QYR22014.1 DUF1836 domain-containing protein [Paenibacillus sp. sptzw28]
MDTFYLTRNQMGALLLSLRGVTEKTPLATLQEAWVKSHKTDVEHGKSLGAFISTSLPPVFEKIIKLKQTNDGFSLADIVALGNQIEYTHFSITSVQNWVKRDFKDLISPPRIGKKYSIDQTAILFIIDDLKATLDFESIRKLLTLVFNDPQHETGDLISPLYLYKAYSSIFEELDQNNDQVLDLSGHESGKRNHDHMLENLIKRRVDEFAGTLEELNVEQRKVVSNTIFIAMVSVQTSYFQSLAKRFLNATLFLQRLN